MFFTIFPLVILEVGILPTAMMNIKIFMCIFNVLILAFVKAPRNILTLWNDSTLPYWTILGYFSILLTSIIYMLVYVYKSVI